MNTPVGPRHGNSVKHNALIQKKEASQEEQQQASSSDIEQSTGRFLTFTIDADTAQIVKLETQDANGARHELSDDERTTLSRERGVGRLEDVVEQAFEAGIACVLGDALRGEHTEESEGDRELRHLLVGSLIEGSGAKRLLQQETLNRILLKTLIQHSVRKPHPAGAEAPAVTGLHTERATGGRTN